MFKPLIRLFNDEENLLKNIIWCLTEYETRLKKLVLEVEKIPIKYTSRFTPQDEFQKEVEFLFNSKE